MKSIPLFESAVDTFMENKAEAIIKHYFPDLEPEFSYDKLSKPGQYSLDKDKAADGSICAMMDVYVGKEKKEEIISKIKDDYETYSKFLVDMGNKKGYEAEVTYSDSDDCCINFNFTKSSFKR